MINKFQISIIFFVYLIYLVLRVAPGPVHKSKSEKEYIEEDEGWDPCVNESGYDPYSPDGETFEELIVKNDHKLGCYIVCSLKENEVINQDGTLNEDRIKEGLDSEEYERFQGCIEESKSLISDGVDECQIALRFMKCAISHFFGTQ